MNGPDGPRLESELTTAGSPPIMSFVTKTIDEINEKIRQGKAVVVTAEEIIDVVREKGIKKAAREVDVVTTGTFGPMCSSGVYLNTGHTKPRIKFGGGNVYLNDVPAYTGLAAVDLFIGATAMPDDDPRNRVPRASSTTAAAMSSRSWSPARTSGWWRPPTARTAIRARNWRR